MSNRQEARSAAQGREQALREWCAASDYDPDDREAPHIEAFEAGFDHGSRLRGQDAAVFSGGEPRPAPSAAQSYDYGRIIDLLQRIRLCAKTVDDALPERTLDGNLRARNYAAQIGTDARELEELLLERHLTIQREAESCV